MPPATAREVIFSDAAPNFAVSGPVYFQGKPVEEITMGLMDVLGRYSSQYDNPPPQVAEDFDQVAREVDAEDIGHGLEDAFRSETTPPFEQMLGQLYHRSDPEQRAGLLNEILGSLGPAAAAGGLGGLAGGPLGALLRRAGQGNRITPEEAEHVHTPEIEAAAAQAARQNPSVMQRAARYYARHPQLVQTLGQAALAIMMNSMARRRRM